jgi:hypothetical protein
MALDLWDTLYVSQLITPLFLLFVDYMKICRVINPVEDCKYLQADIYSVQKWCLKNFMDLNIRKTDAIYFTCRLRVPTKSIKDFPILM